MRMIHPGSSYHRALDKKILKDSWYISEGQHCPFDVILVAFHLTLERGAFLILFDASERKLEIPSANETKERSSNERRAKLKKKAVEILATT